MCIKYEVENKKCEELLNVLKFKKISIKELDIKKDRISFVCNSNQKDKINSILKKQDIEIFNINFLTSARVINFFKERIALIILIFTMIPMLYYRLSFLKNIEIVGNEYISLDSIYITLRENDVRVGMKLDELNTGYLENKFYIKYNNLKFITFNLVGTNLYVEMIDYKDDNVV